MALADQLSKIAQKIQPKINRALKTDVANAVKDEEIKAIDDVVYGAYEPEVYERRAGSGGLGDPKNIKFSVENGELSVWNSTKPNPGGVRNSHWVSVRKHLDELVEYGHGSMGGDYDFPRDGRAYMNPRPFTQKTIDNLNANKNHVTALKESLENQGFTIN